MNKNKSDKFINSTIKMSSLDDQQGGIGLLLFHCEFNKNLGSITHYMENFDEILYKSLPNLYAVCIAITDKNKKEIHAGFFIKTSFQHGSSEFLTNLELAVQSIPNLKKYPSKRMTFLPAKIGIDGPPPTETEMLKIMTTQYTKFSVAGKC